MSPRTRSTTRLGAGVAVRRRAAGAGCGGGPARGAGAGTQRSARTSPRIPDPVRIANCENEKKAFCDFPSVLRLHMCDLGSYNVRGLQICSLCSFQTRVKATHP